MIYCNDNDPGACAWARELMAAGLVPKGVVDERKIQDIQPADLVGYRQCHFFSGILGWVEALRLAGWAADRPVWTGSCPCPPFSAAGKKKRCPACQNREVVPHPLKTGIFACVGCAYEWLADERHLWPEFLRLIRECRPPVVIGEQVSGADGVVWLAGVRATLEQLGYAVGCLDLAAGSVGAPHIRQRLYWLAHRDGAGHAWPGIASEDGSAEGDRPHAVDSLRDGADGRLADAGRTVVRCERQPLGGETGGGQGEENQRERLRPDAGDGSDAGRLANADGRDASDRDEQRGRQHGQQPPNGGAGGGVGDTVELGWGRDTGTAPGAEGSSDSGRQVDGPGGEQPGLPGAAGGLGDAAIIRHRGAERGQVQEGPGGMRPDLERQLPDGPPRSGGNGFRLGDTGNDGPQDDNCPRRWPGAVVGANPWHRSAIIYCRDGKARRAQSRLQLIFNGLPAGVDDLRLASDGFPLTSEKIEGRVGLLRGSGNAIVPAVAAAFIKAFLATEQA